MICSYVACSVVYVLVEIFASPGLRLGPNAGSPCDGQFWVSWLSWPTPVLRPSMAIGHTDPGKLSAACALRSRPPADLLLSSRNIDGKTACSDTSDIMHLLRAER